MNLILWVYFEEKLTTINNHHLSHFFRYGWSDVALFFAVVAKSWSCKFCCHFKVTSSALLSWSCQISNFGPFWVRICGQSHLFCTGCQKGQHHSKDFGNRCENLCNLKRPPFLHWVSQLQELGEQHHSSHWILMPKRRWSWRTEIRSSSRTIWPWRRSC